MNLKTIIGDTVINLEIKYDNILTMLSSFNIIVDIGKIVQSLAMTQLYKGKSALRLVLR